MNKDGTEQQQISTLKGASLNVADGYLYFLIAGSNSNRGIYRMKVDGTDTEQLLADHSMSSGRIAVWGEHVYYLAKENGVFRIPIDGGESEQIGEKAYENFMIADGVLYATLWDRDEEDESIINDCYALPALTALPSLDNIRLQMYASGGYLYVRQDGDLYRMLPSGEVGQQIETSYGIIPFGESVYYRDQRVTLISNFSSQAAGYIYRLDPSTNIRVLLVDWHCTYFNVLNDFIIFNFFNNTTQEVQRSAYRLSTREFIPLP